LSLFFQTKLLVCHARKYSFGWMRDSVFTKIQNSWEIHVIEMGKAKEKEKAKICFNCTKIVFGTEVNK